MCEPVSTGTALMLAMSAATAAVTYAQAEDAAEKAEKAAHDNYNQGMQTVNEQYRQQNDQATQEMSIRAQEARKEMARARVIAGESGAIGGVSDSRIAHESQMALQTDMATISANRKNANNQTHLEAKGLHAGARGQISQIRQPSLIASGLQIAGTYTESVATERRLNRSASQSSSGNYRYSDTYKPDSLRGGR